MNKHKPRHAVREDRILEINGRPIGHGVIVHYEDGPPDFGVCEWDDCDDPATEETVLGTQFCRKHLSAFYSFGDEEDTEKLNWRLRFLQWARLNLLD